jgi:tetratricopeptide (TPR) repeat protein
MGTCRSCGRVTTLTSYDTGLYVVVLFIPVIPLGRKRIIEECGACRRHAVLPLADWERAKRRADDAIAAYRNAPTNSDLAEEALRACASYRNLPALLNLAPDVERNLPRDAKTLGILSVVYDGFGRTGDAERVLRLAVTNEPAEHATEKDASIADEVREMLASCLIRQGKTGEAEEHVRHVIDDAIPDRIDVLYQLAQGYQLQGNHEKALEYFGHCETINPHILQDETFVRLRNASAEKRGTAAVVSPAKIVKKAKSAESRRKLMKRAPVILALAVLAYLALAYVQGTREMVYFVNGLSRPYSVRIAGGNYTLPPFGNLPIRVKDGDVKYETVGLEGASSVAHVARVHTSLLTRPFASNAVLINPDRAALVEQSRHYYGQGLNPQTSKPSQKYFVGEEVYHFSGIDYVMEAAPHSIKADSKSSQISKQRVGLVNGNSFGLPPAYVLMAVEKELGKPAVAKAAQQHLLLEPEQREFLAVLQGAMTPQQIIDFLKPHLSERPVRLQWHRAYQEQMTSLNRDEEVEREYHELLAKQPDDSEMMYLASRVERDLTRADELCEKALTMPQPCAYAAYSLAWRHMGQGEFDKALDRARLAVKLSQGGADDFNFMVKRALLAAGHFDEAAQEYAKDRGGPVPLAIASAADEAYAHQRAHHTDRAEDALSALKSRMKQLHLGDEVIAEIDGIKANLAYADGNTAAYVGALTTPTASPEQRLMAHLTDGDVASADPDFSLIENPTWQSHLLTYIVANTAGKADLAGKHLNAATAILTKGKTEHRMFAEALNLKTNVPTEELLRQRLDGEEKLILLTALGLRKPDAREAAFALAQKLNVDRRFPHLLIKSVVGGQ